MSSLSEGMRDIRVVVCLAILAVVVGHLLSLAGCVWPTPPPDSPLPTPTPDSPLSTPVSPLPTVVSPLPEPVPDPVSDSISQGGILMTADELSAIAGMVLSLVFSYIPGVSKWFEGLTSGYKQLTMGVLLLVVAGAIFGLACGGVVDTVVCDQAGALGLVKVLIAALIANQSIYLITKK